MTGVTTFTQAKADAICERIAQGESLRAICRDEAMPHASTVCKWLADIPGFSEQYARAREAQADALFDEILEIADDASEDWTTREGRDGVAIPVLNGEAVARAKLRVDARKWMAGKLQPKKYGDRTTLDVTVRPEEALSDDELTRGLAAIRRTLSLAAGGAGDQASQGGSQAAFTQPVLELQAVREADGVHRVGEDE